MKRILFYISGHGYGHATRIIEVIKQIHFQSPQTEIHIQTNTPAWIFSMNLQNEYHFIPQTCDVGVVQQNSFEVDAKATLEAFSKFFQTWEERLPNEVNYLIQSEIDVVVGDIPPMAFLAAKKAGLPALAIANFSWDWIYTPYVEEYREFEWIIDTIQSAYQNANQLLRLPFYGNLSAFKKTMDIPIIAGKATKSTTEMRKSLEVDEEKKLVLVALRNPDLETINLQSLTNLKNTKFIFLHLVPDSSNFIHFSQDKYHFPNLVAASDVIVTKPGYGIISECLANETPILYTSRTGFLEYDILVKAIEDLQQGLLIPQNDFFAGEWEPYLSQIFTQKNIRYDQPVNGAEIAAQIILEM